MRRAPRRHLRREQSGELNPGRCHRTLICNSVPAYNNVWSLQRGDRRNREGGAETFSLSLHSPSSSNPPLPALSQLLSPSMNAPSGPMTSLAWNAWLPPEISSRAPRRHMLLMTSTQWAAARFFSLRLWPASPLTLPPSACSSTSPSLSSSFSLCVGQSSVNSICSAHHITGGEGRREPSSQWVLLWFLCMRLYVCIQYMWHCGNAYYVYAYICAVCTCLRVGLTGSVRQRESE